MAVVRRKVLSDAGGEGRCRCKSSRDQIHFAQIDDEPLMAVLVGFASGYVRAGGFTDGGRLGRIADDRASAKGASP